MKIPMINTIRTIVILLALIFTDGKKTPVRLGKKQETWTQRNYETIMTILVTILLILSMALFITLCFVINGKTEANTYYYHLRDII